MTCTVALFDHSLVKFSQIIFDLEFFRKLSHCEKYVPCCALNGMSLYV